MLTRLRSRVRCTRAPFSTVSGGAGGAGKGDLKINSKGLTGDKNKKPQEPGSWVKMSMARGNLRATGWTDEDFSKPIITIGSPWTNANPCNNRIRELTDLLVEAVEEAGGKAFVAGTPVISDGMTNGSDAMRYSLISRDYIADCIEIMHEGYMADAMITLSGCDKTVPAALMPIPRGNHFGLTLYGGTALPGHCAGCSNAHGGEGLDAKDVMEAIGSYSAGKISADDLAKLEARALPGSGTCSAMFTANTMSSAIEALGMSPPGTASHPVVDFNNRLSDQKRLDVRAAVQLLLNLMRRNIRSRDIMTMQAFENAITVVYALGGSTNAILHLLALAHEAEVPLKIDDFQRVGSRVPLLANLSPHGPFHMSDLDKLGGVPVVMRELMEHGLLHGNCMTVTGQTVTENLKNVARIKDLGEQKVGATCPTYISV